MGAYSRLDHLAKPVKNGRRRAACPPHLFLVLETFADHKLFLLRLGLRINQKGKILLTCPEPVLEGPDEKGSQQELPEMKQDKWQDQQADRAMPGASNWAKGRPMAKDFCAPQNKNATASSRD